MQNDKPDSPAEHVAAIKNMMATSECVDVVAAVAQLSRKRTAVSDDLAALYICAAGLDVLLADAGAAQLT